jgi:hypothetical protein
MPENSSASNTSASGESYKPQSDYSYTQPYGGMKGFMESHGLKLWNDDDIAEAKSIINGYRANDAYDAAEDAKANSK